MLTYTGMITRIRYYNEDSKFIVATFEANEEVTPFTITGNMSYVESDERYRIEGEFIQHPRYGKQFQLRGYEVLLADDRERIIRYLSSSLFKGIGEKQATAIVDALGENALKMIKEDASCLRGIKGMNENKMNVIKQVIDNQSYDQQVLSFFMGHGISTRNLGLIQGFYKERTLDVLQNNPYQLIDDIDGVGFKSADTLAKKLNFAADHPYRLKAAVAYALLERCFQTGSTYAYLDEIKKAAFRFVPQLTLELFDEYLQELLDEIGANFHVPVDYIKSTSYLMSFMRDYQLKRDVEKYFKAHPDEIRKIKKDSFWLRRAQLDRYDRIPNNNARLERVMNNVLQRGVEKLLWMPPSRPYYEMEGVYKNTEFSSKTLIFSAWDPWATSR